MVEPKTEIFRFRARGEVDFEIHATSLDDAVKAATERIRKPFASSPGEPIFRAYPYEIPGWVTGYFVARFEAAESD